MEADKHPYHSIDFEYLRPPKSVVCKKTVEQELTHLKGVPVYRNLYYGVNIPKDQAEKTKIYNNYLQEEADTIKPHMPEFWSFHDSWRFADAASYKREDMCRDARNHSPWIEEMKSWNLSKESQEIIDSGKIYLCGRGKNGYPCIWVNIKDCDTKEALIPQYENALIFLTAIVKKYMLLPYYCELMNLVIDLGNCSVFSLPKKFMSAMMEIHKLHFKNSMYKCIIFDPSFTFWALWKGVSMLFNQKYLERIRIIKKKSAIDLQEILEKDQMEVKYGGVIPNLTKGQFFPPKNYDTDIVDKAMIEEQGIMTFDFLGHQNDKHFFKKCQTWKPEHAEDLPAWFTKTGSLDKEYYPL